MIEDLEIKLDMLPLLNPGALEYQVLLLNALPILNSRLIEDLRLVLNVIQYTFT